MPTQLMEYMKTYSSFTEAVTSWSMLSRRLTTFRIENALQQLTFQMTQFFASVLPLWSSRLQYLSVDFVSEHILPLLLSESQNITISFTSHYLSLKEMLTAKTVATEALLDIMTSICISVPCGLCIPFSSEFF